MMKSERNTRINSRLLKTVFVKTLPVMAGYIVLGLGFGVLLEKKWIWYLVGTGYESFYLCRFHAVCDDQSSDIGCDADIRSADDFDGKCKASFLWDFHGGEV